MHSMQMNLECVFHHCLKCDQGSRTSGLATVCVCFEGLVSVSLLSVVQ